MSKCNWQDVKIKFSTVSVSKIVPAKLRLVQMSILRAVTLSIPMWKEVKRMATLKL